MVGVFVSFSYAKCHMIQAPPRRTLNESRTCHLIVHLALLFKIHIFWDSSEHLKEFNSLFQRTSDAFNWKKVVLNPWLIVKTAVLRRFKCYRSYFFFSA